MEDEAERTVGEIDKYFEELIAAVKRRAEDLKKEFSLIQ
jgi:hypothetical protein